MLNISYLTTLSIHTPGVHRRCSNLELAAEHCQNLGTALAGESPPTIAGNIFPGALAHRGRPRYPWTWGAAVSHDAIDHAVR